MKKLSNPFRDDGCVAGQPSRRNLLLSGFGVAVAFIAARANATPIAGPEGKQEVTIESFSAAGVSLGTARVEKLQKSNVEWRKQLSAASYRVTRHEGTEAPFSGQYAVNHADGIYRCICCETAAFDSKTKFESGTGWPSFWQPISAMNVVKTVDNSFGMRREAISCKLCDAHLGHVFTDGPRPTGLRYCMNSVALHFVARA